MKIPFDIDTVMKSVSKIRLKGGVVGKVCTVLVVLCIVVAFMAWVAKNPWIVGGAILLLIIICFVMLWRVIQFANKNPAAALMEGAEFLLHQQLILGSKHTPAIPVDPRDFSELPTSEVSQQQAQLTKPMEPDVPPAKSSNVAKEGDDHV